MCIIAFGSSVFVLPMFSSTFISHQVMHREMRSLPHHGDGPDPLHTLDVESVAVVTALFYSNWIEFEESCAGRNLHGDALDDYFAKKCAWGLGKIDLFAKT